MSPKQLICSICTIRVQSRCTSCISLNVKNIFIQSNLHTYQNIATTKSARWRLLFNKEKFIKNTHTWPRWRFQKVYRFPCQFYRPKPRIQYNAEMSLQLRIHNCRIQETAFRQLSGCASMIIFGIIQLSCCLNMAPAECPVSSTVNFPQ